jgi:hypothetical protein
MSDGPAPARPIPPKPRKRRVLLWLILILLAAMFIAGVVLAPRIMATLPAWITGASPTATPQPTASLPATPAPLPLAAAPEAAPVTPAASEPDELHRRLALLESEVNRLSGKAAAEGDVSGTVTALNNQVALLFNQLTEVQARLKAAEESSPKALLKPMAVLALSRLRQAVEQGVTYAGALGGVQRLLDGTVLPEAASKALLTLDAHKNEGVVSVMALRDGFAAKVGDIIDAEAAPANASWWDRTLARLENMITVRPTGDVKGTDAPAITARAEAALNRGDLDTAVRELHGLSPSAAVAVADWLQQAQTRQAVLGAVDTLETALLDSAAVTNANTNRTGATP